MRRISALTSVAAGMLSFGACSAATVETGLVSAHRGPHLRFGEAFGYRIGQSIEAVQTHARSRGDQLHCQEITDVPEVPAVIVCQPEGMMTRSTPPPPDSLLALMAQPPLPRYTLFLSPGGALDFITVTLGYGPELTRPKVETLFDELGDRRVEGRASSGGSEHVLWTASGTPDYAELECRQVGDAELCKMRIGRVPNAEEVDWVVDSVRRRAPLPLKEMPPA